jgi:hypothetical protein
MLCANFSAYNLPKLFASFAKNNATINKGDIYLTKRLIIILRKACYSMNLKLYNCLGFTACFSHKKIVSNLRMLC